MSPPFLLRHISFKLYINIRYAYEVFIIFSTDTVLLFLCNNPRKARNYRFFGNPVWANQAETTLQRVLPLTTPKLTTTATYHPRMIYFYGYRVKAMVTGSLGDKYLPPDGQSKFLHGLIGIIYSPVIALLTGETLQMVDVCTRPHYHLEGGYYFWTGSTVARIAEQPQVVSFT